MITYEYFIKFDITQFIVLIVIKVRNCFFKGASLYACIKHDEINVLTEIGNSEIENVSLRMLLVEKFRYAFCATGIRYSMLRVMSNVN